MIKFTKRKKIEKTDLEAMEKSRAQTRATHGIEMLEVDEELIDDDTFSQMHQRLAHGRSGPEAGASTDDTPEPDSAEEELLLVEVVTELPDKNSARRAAKRGVVAAPETPAEVARLEAEMAEAKTRDDVVRLALRLVLRYARVGALFVVHRGIIAGFAALGDDIAERIEGVMIPEASDSLFATPVSTGKPVRGAPSAGALDARVLRALGRDAARELLVVPVAIRGRVVNLLYVDNGADALPITSVAAVRALALCMASTYERIILEMKQAP